LDLVHSDAQPKVRSGPFLGRTGDQFGADDDDRARASRAPVVRAAALKAAIAQLRDIAGANDGRSSRQALMANLLLLRSLGVEDEALDLVVALVLEQNVDEGMTAAINYLASGFLSALLTLREEGSFGKSCHA
jgi:hypothetical protein